MAQNIFNSVSSRPAIGDEDQGINDDPSIKKIYHGSTVVYENAHLPIANNSIAHPWWEADTQYAAADAKGQLERYWNGHQELSGFSSIYTDGWGHYSPLYANSDYSSYIGRYYLYRFNALNPDGTSSSESGKYLDDEHVDLARTTSGYSSNALSGTGTGATAQKRILLMHGAGNILQKTLAMSNYNASRKYPLPPITSCATSNHNTFGLSNSGSSGWASQAAERWYYAQMFTSVTAPDDATQATFGCYVRQPSNDPLRTNNGGCIQLKQIFTGSQYLEGRIDNIIIRGDSSSKLTDLRTGDVTTTVNFYNQAHFQWSGPNHTANFTSNSDSIHLWNDKSYISAHQFVDAADIDNFKKVERTVTLESGTSRRYNFSVGFLENHANLKIQSNSSDGPSGAIWFYNCFVVFS